MEGCPQELVLLVSTLTLDHSAKIAIMFYLCVSREEKGGSPLGVIFKNPLASITFGTVGLFSVPRCL
jgi:hypothetical protein